MPGAEPLWQAPPLAAVLGDVEHGIEKLQVRYPDIASLYRQTVLDPGILLFTDLHPPQFTPAERK